MMLITCAGMYRSASTWLYNAVRIITKNKYPHMECGWMGDKTGIPKNIDKKVFVGKLHNFDSEVNKHSYLIFTSHRDIKDVIASFYRTSAPKKNLPKPLSEFVTEILNNYKIWARKANFDMDYEEFIKDPKQQIEKIMDCFVIKPRADVDKILKEVEEAGDIRGDGTRHHEVTLYHKEHFTYGKSGDWKTELDETDLKQIEEGIKNAN